MSVAKVVELVGSSPQSWDDAAQVAVKRAAKTIRGVRGIDLVGMTAVVKGGKITEYRSTVKISFGIEEK